MKIKMATCRCAAGQRIGEPGSLPYAELDVDNHPSAVIIFGETQEIADERAARIIAAVAHLESAKGTV